MPQTGSTAIISYHTTTAAATPSAANLSAGELALNVTDLKIYTENGGGSVVQIGSGPSATDTLTNKTIDLTSNTLVATSAQIKAAVTDETGSGSLVFATSPTLVTPVLGAASATSLTLTTDLAVADGGTGRSTGTTAYALVATGTTATGAQQTLASGATTEVLVGGGASALPVWTTATGTGAPVRATSPTLTTPAITGPATVSASSGTALKVTNTGTGDSFVVEDSASTDSTPFVIDASGRVIVGHTDFITYGQSVTPQVQLDATTATYLGIGRWSASNAAAAGGMSFLRSRGATVGAHTVVASGDTIANVFFDADDGTNYIPAASIVAAVDGTPGTNDMPGRLIFSTTADGAAAPTERLRINSAGQTLIGSTTAPTWNKVKILESQAQCLELTSTDTDATTKTGRISVSHYTNAEEPASVLGLSSSATVSQITVGGGSALQNAATKISFYTAANNTTVTGTERVSIDSDGTVLVKSAAGLGYGTGAGGTVTQATSRTTGVTLNKPTGAITLVSAAGSTTIASFTVTNSLVADTDTVVVSQKSGTDLYEIHVTAVATGSFRISFKTTGGTTTEQPVFNFAIIKGATA